MDVSFTRRGWLQGVAAASGAAAAAHPAAAAARLARHRPGWVRGHMTGARAVAETLLAEGTDCVFGIPGAQENELWDTFKTVGVPYLLVAHEFSAACMADGSARSTGRPGVLCVVPGPGVTNALTGLGEALLDSVPVVCVVGDIARGADFRHFQVHSLDSVALLRPVTKGVFPVAEVGQIAGAVRQAFALARCGEPGPAAVVIPYNLFIEKGDFDSPPLPPPAVPFDEAAFEKAVALLADPRLRVGIYAGLGCMDCANLLAAAAEMLQAPVATSVCGKGAMPEDHPLAVGWGYGPHATLTSERVFGGRRLRPLKTGVDCVLAIGVRYSEVSTGFYGNPETRRLIHVDINPHNLGRVKRADVCVHADAGLFLTRLLACADRLRRPHDAGLYAEIRACKAEERRAHARSHGRCGVDPMALILALRRGLPPDGMLFVDVSVAEHLAAEAYLTCRPRTYFNPTDNQSMGWSIPAGIGAQRVNPGRPTAVLTGDGCFLMSAMEISTAGRENLPVKFFVLDDGTYKYMQMLQEPAYMRTTATVLARLDYAALARGLGVAYLEVTPADPLDAAVRAALCHPGPVLVRVVTDYGDRKIRWIEAVRDRYVDELSAAQKARFLARLGARAANFRPEADD
ncbi:MAG TPA: thiamine pyrophosphate-binding protein [Gemmataceae bacterium]